MLIARRRLSASQSLCMKQVARIIWSPRALRLRTAVLRRISSIAFSINRRCNRYIDGSILVLPRMFAAHPERRFCRPAIFQAGRVRRSKQRHTSYNVNAPENRHVHFSRTPVAEISAHMPAGGCVRSYSRTTPNQRAMVLSLIIPAHRERRPASSFRRHLPTTGDLSF